MDNKIGFGNLTDASGKAGNCRRLGDPRGNTADVDTNDTRIAAGLRFQQIARESGVLPKDLLA